jgi:hypothetical protein
VLAMFSLISNAFSCTVGLNSTLVFITFTDTDGSRNAAYSEWVSVYAARGRFVLESFIPPGSRVCHGAEFSKRCVSAV